MSASICLLLIGSSRYRLLHQEAEAAGACRNQETINWTRCESTVPSRYGYVVADGGVCGGGSKLDALGFFLHYGVGSYPQLPVSSQLHCRPRGEGRAGSRRRRKPIIRGARSSETSRPGPRTIHVVATASTRPAFRYIGRGYWTHRHIGWSGPGQETLRSIPDSPQLIQEAVRRFKHAFENRSCERVAVLSPRGRSAETSRGDAAAATWIFRRDESRRRRGTDVEVRSRPAHVAGTKRC